MKSAQIYSLTLKNGKAMAYQYTDSEGMKHRAIVPMYRSKSGKLAPPRREFFSGKSWTKALNRGWGRVVSEVIAKVK